MKIVLIFDQGLAGAGGKSNPNLGLQLAKGGIGTALILDPHFKKIGGNVLATLYCGNQYFLENKEEVITKFTAMVKKINPDIVVCGPCFNFADYAKMSAMVTHYINTKTEIPAVAMMSQENSEIIEEYKDKIKIIKMPKKGGTGLSDSFDDLVEWLAAKYNNDLKLSEIEQRICY